MGELAHDLDGNAAAQQELRQRGAEEIARRRAAKKGQAGAGAGDYSSDDEYMSDGGTVYAKGAAAKKARAKAIAEGKLAPRGFQPASPRGTRGWDGYNGSGSGSDVSGMPKHSRKEMAKLLREEGGMLADLDRLKQLEAVETEQACKDVVEWMIRCLEVEQAAAAEEAARRAREAAEAAEREARARRDAELEARLAGLEAQVAAQKAFVEAAKETAAAQEEIDAALREQRIAELIAKGDDAVGVQRFAEAVGHYDGALEIDAENEEALRKREAAAAAAAGDLSLLSEAERLAAEKAAREKAKRDKKGRAQAAKDKRAKEEEARLAREEAAAARKRAADGRKNKRKQDASGRAGRGGGRSGSGGSDNVGAVVARGMPGYAALTIPELRERFDMVDQMGNGDGEIGTYY
jgi:uncharacterized coiled-coil protein SlyX